MNDEDRDIVVYAWPDGACVTCSVESRDGNPPQALFRVHGHESDDGLGPDNLWVDDDERTVETERGYAFPYQGSALKKILGFLLDLGVSGKRDGISLLSTPEGGNIAPYPVFVEDDRWNDRYEEAATHLTLSAAPHDFLGALEAASVYLGEVDSNSRSIGPDGITLLWGPDYATERAYAQTLKEVVDEAIKQAFVLPLSKKDEWDAANIERGTWITPSAEEVELYQMLGEPLPFWWDPERFWEWLEEQRAMGNGGDDGGF